MVNLHVPACFLRTDGGFSGNADSEDDNDDNDDGDVDSDRGEDGNDNDSGEGKRISLKYTRKMIDFIHAENVMEDKQLSCHLR